MPSIFFVAFLSTSTHSVAKTLSISLVAMSSVICGPTWVSNSTLGEALASSSARDSPFAARGVHKDSSRQSRWRRGARHLLANLLLGSRNPQTGIPSPLVSSYQLKFKMPLRPIASRAFSTNLQEHYMPHLRGTQVLPRVLKVLGRDLRALRLSSAASSRMPSATLSWTRSPTANTLGDHLDHALQELGLPLLVLALAPS
mmetsp:Transcript_105846/g.338026  ORF Transcript_105846/g.338026 Transcript_105846/m.338026 type:complete len:200 (-) Transcript_105846:598-1197(-)